MLAMPPPRWLKTLRQHVTQKWGLWWWCLLSLFTLFGAQSKSKKGSQLGRWCRMWDRPGPTDPRGRPDSCRRFSTGPIRFTGASYFRSHGTQNRLFQDPLASLMFASELFGYLLVHRLRTVFAPPKNTNKQIRPLSTSLGSAPRRLDR